METKRLTVKSVKTQIERCGSSSYLFVGIVKYSNHTFKIKYDRHNGSPLGSDTNRCLYVLTEAGTWSYVDDINTICPNYIHVSYLDSEEVKKQGKDQFVAACINYLKLIYGD